MIKLRSLGECVIEIDSGRVRPDSEVIFAALLYLLVARGRRIDRGTLGELLWPESDGLSARHCVRQTIYRLKQLGVPLVGDQTSLELPSRDTELDYELMADDTHLEPQPGQATLALVRGVFLPGYVPRVSPAFAEWLEQHREHVHARVRRVLLASLGAARSAARWDTVEEIARRCLEFDPLNEEATLALAEATAMAGSKAQALRILDRYVHELGPTAAGIHLPAAVLRRRVAESLPDRGPLVNLDGPFVGRSESLAYLSHLFKRATRGAGSACLITGEPGIGKTRLCDEFARLVRLQGGVVVTLRCSQFEKARPIGAFANLIKQLMNLRGAAGCDPCALALLGQVCLGNLSIKKLAAANPLSTRDVSAAASELIGAISEENHLALIIEDIRTADTQSQLLIEQVISAPVVSRPLFILTTRTDERLAADHTHEATCCHDLGPLRRTDAETLFDELTSTPISNSSAEARDWCVSIAGGNPFYLQQLAAHWVATGTTATVPPSITSLLSKRQAMLSSPARRVLQCCAVLGQHATVTRIHQALELRRTELLDAISELETNGFVLTTREGIRVRHDLISSEALRALTPGARRLLHIAVATVFTRELRACPASAVLWDCVYHWEQAGDSSTAAALTREIAARNVALGVPAEALAVLEPALSAPASPYAKLGLHELIAHGLRVSFQWRSYARVAKDLANLRREHGRTEPQHTDDELALLESRWRSGEPAGVLLSASISCAGACACDPLHRLRAALLALIMADSTVDTPAVASIYRSVGDLLLEDTGLSPEVLLVHIVYHSAYGDLDTAVEASRQLIDLDAARSDHAGRIRRARMCAVPLRRAGLGDDARKVLVRAMKEAERLRLAAHAIAVADLLASRALDYQDLDEARHWLDRARRWAALTPDLDVHVDTAELGIRIALFAQQPTLARQLFEAARYEPWSEDGSRHTALIQALLLGIELCENEAPNGVAIAALRGAHLRMRGHGGQDVPAMSLFEALARMGAVEEATRLCSEYFLAYRRERTSAVPFPHYAFCGSLLRSLPSGRSPAVSQYS